MDYLAIKFVFLVLIPLFYIAHQLISNEKKGKRMILPVFSVIVLLCFESLLGGLFILSLTLVNLCFKNVFGSTIIRIINIILIGIYGNLSFLMGFLILYFDLNWSMSFQSGNKFMLCLFAISQHRNITSIARVRTEEYFSLSLLSIVLPILAFVQFEKVISLFNNFTFSKIELKSFKLACKILFFGLVVRLFFIVPSMQVIAMGIHSEFSLNMPQAIIALGSNGVYIIGQLVFSYIVLYSMLVLAKNEVDGKEIVQEKLFSFRFVNTPVVQNSLILFVIFYASGVGLILSVFCFVFLLLYGFFCYSKLQSKLVAIILLLFLFLALTSENIYQFKFVIQGLFSIHTLFQYYNELYLIYAAGGGFYLSTGLLILFTLILKYRKPILNRFLANSSKYDIVYVFLLPLIILIQL